MWSLKPLFKELQKMFASSRIRIQEGSRVPGDKELGVQRTIVITNNFIIVELIFSRGVGVPSTIPQCKPGGLVNTPRMLTARRV